MPSWFPDARSVGHIGQPSRERARHDRRLAGALQSVSHRHRAGDDKGRTPMFTRCRVKEWRQEKTRTGRGPAFVSDTSKGYPESVRAYHWQHSHWDLLKKAECFPKSGCEQLGQYREGTTNLKIINTIRQAFSLGQCKCVCTGDSQGLCGTLPHVRGTSNGQKTKEQK